MLVLSRRSGESIIINDNIELKIVEVKGDYVKVGINAPRHIPVHRKEIFEAIQRENARAAQTQKTSVSEAEHNLPDVPPRIPSATPEPPPAEDAPPKKATTPRTRKKSKES